MTALLGKIADYADHLNVSRPPALSGRVSRFDGQMVACDGFPASIGTLCAIDLENGGETLGEIIGFEDGQNMLSLHEYGAQVKVGATVRAVEDGAMVNVGEGLLGRVIDGLGQPLDGRPLAQQNGRWPLAGMPLNPLQRSPVTEPLDVGVRVINSLLSIGCGQRLGIIAGSGVGKSVLLGMMTRFTEADVVVVGLVGERGREVGHFVEKALTGTSKARTIIVAVPADRSPLLRIRGAERATAIAEYFRAQGRKVLLIMDSLTRVAHARREIGLAMGEQPTSKGYPPSVVSMIPRLIERTGTDDRSKGSITAIYTVLADGDDAHDPVVDAARAILDGHIVLSRLQAQMGIYPAVDVTSSVSRVMNDITNEGHQDAARKFRRLVSVYMENRDLIYMGGYSPGQDPELDEAVRVWGILQAHIEQPETERADYAESRARLIATLAG